MNLHRNTERRLSDYYAAEAPPRAPDRVLQSALDIVDITPQRRARTGVPWRFPGMDTPARAALAAAAAVAIAATGLAVVGPGNPPSVGGSPVATSQQGSIGSPGPSVPVPPALTGAFTSAIHGLSIAYPEGWAARPATEPWATGQPLFHSPFGDHLYDRGRGDHLYLGLYSQSLGGQTIEDWADAPLASCRGTQPATVDGRPGLLVAECMGTLAALVAAEDRAYLILLHVSADDPSLGDVYDGAWFRQVLATVDLRPGDAVEATGEQSSLPFEPPFTYVLPATDEFEYGPRNAATFEVRVPAAFEAGHPKGVIVWSIGGGRTDPCSASSPALPIEGGPEAVIDYLGTVPGLEVTEESPTTVDGMPAHQAIVTPSPEPGCEEISPWAADTGDFVPVAVRTIAVDVRGEHVVIAVFGEDDNPGWTETANELIDSFRFQPPPASP